MKTIIFNPMKLWLAFTLTATFLFSQPLVPQNIVVEPGDKEVLVLRLSEYIGSLQWQVSPDGKDWSNVPNAMADTLVVSSKLNLYFRGNVTLPDCPEYYTNIVQILADSLESRRMVVAHFMVGIPMYRDAERITVASIKKDITDAHEQGIDAFQINIPDYTSARQDIVAKLFQAASECDFPFYLFLSADYNERIANPMRFNEILDFMTRYASHPNHLKFNGRPLFTTWLGSQEGADYWKTIKQRLLSEHHISVFYVPFYGIYFRGKGGVTEAVMEDLLDEYEGVIDGYWNWGGRSNPFPEPGSTRTIPHEGEVISKALERRSMPFMSPVLPAFWMTYKEPEIYSEYEGGRGMESQWMSVINSQKATKWVNLVTWNDMGEDSHWSPHPLPRRNPVGGQVWTHAGHAELNKYYIQWWKTGQPPAIKEDKLFYFYKNQFHDAQALNPEGYGNGNFVPAMQLADKIYVTTMLTAPATLTIHSGSRTTVYDVLAGIHHWDADMGVGTQQFTLIRDGKTVIHMTGEKTVEETPQYKTWSIFSGFATGMD